MHSFEVVDDVSKFSYVNFDLILESNFQSILNTLSLFLEVPMIEKVKYTIISTIFIIIDGDLARLKYLSPKLLIENL